MNTRGDLLERNLQVNLPGSHHPRCLEGPEVKLRPDNPSQIAASSTDLCPRATQQLQRVDSRNPQGTAITMPCNPGVSENSPTLPVPANRSRLVSTPTPKRNRKFRMCSKASQVFGGEQLFFFLQFERHTIQMHLCVLDLSSIIIYSINVIGFVFGNTYCSFLPFCQADTF